MEYTDFIQNKLPTSLKVGFAVDAETLNSNLFPFQRKIVTMALEAGRYAIFADCGLGKTLMQLEWATQVARHTGERVLILAPLAVVMQTKDEATKFGVDLSNIDITNYEQLDNINTNIYAGVVLDESSILKNFTGKTKKKLIAAFAETHYRLCCTATPAPNDLNEIGNHSEFLGVMDANDMRMRWFVRDEGMNNYRLKGHAETDFYTWVASWASVLRTPADIGFSSEGYILPELRFFDHMQRKTATTTNTLNARYENPTNHTNNAMNTLPEFPLTASDCWAQRDYILSNARKFEACELEYEKAEQAKDGTELLTILTENACWVNDRLYQVNQLPEPEEVPNLTTLDCSGCTGLTTLPEYPNLTNLDCWGCTDLTSLPDFPKLTRLDCRYCPGLTTLPRYPNLTTLYCAHCTSLTTLPEFPNLTTLDCDYCTSLTTLPEFPNLTELDCRYCTRLATLAEFPNLTWLYCAHCTSLTTLPEYPNLTWLNCRYCTSLTTLPEYSCLTNLYCAGCTGLTTLPEYPNLIRLDYPPHLE